MHVYIVNLAIQTEIYIPIDNMKKKGGKSQEKSKARVSVGMVTPRENERVLFTFLTYWNRWC